VVVTGDWITYRGPGQLEQLRRVIEHLPRGALGTIGILGNHDYGFRWRMIEVAEQVVRVASEAGVTMLRDDAAMVNGLRFVGIEELWSPRFTHRPPPAFREEGPPTIALCHNPDGSDQHLWGLHRGWILSGHTHGGQCKPPFLPPPLLPVANRRYTSGFFDVPGGRTMYISRGVGHLIQARFNVRPEVPVFRLRRVVDQIAPASRTPGQERGAERVVTSVPPTARANPAPGMVSTSTPSPVQSVRRGVRA
jgi:predicted MPP superfamily phosphohydrolase